MIQMRKYYLQNKIGERYDFQQYNKVILKNPDNLGFDFKNGYVRIGTRFVVDSIDLGQKNPSFDLLFFDNYYNEYQKFAEFIFSSSDYKLVYVINNIEYLLDIDILKLTKGDADEEGMSLSVKITFACKGLYYLKKEKVHLLAAQKDENRFDLEWDFTFNDEIPATIDCMNNGQIPASFELEILGYCNNPTITVTNLNNNTVKTLTFNVEIKKNEKLLFSTVEDNLYIQKESNGIKTNILNSIFYNENINFFQIDVGKNLIRIDTNIVEAKLVLYESYYII